MDKVKSVFYKHLGDVTPEVFDAYLEHEEKFFTALVDRCDLKLMELEAEFKSFASLARSYNTFAMPLLTIATYQKLRPDATEEEKKAMYFAAWIADWANTCYIVINDICDGREKRAGQPTPAAQFGSANAMCLYIIISNMTYDLAAETFAQEPWLLPFFKVCRQHINRLSLAMLIDNSCGKYDRRRSLKWYQVREDNSTTGPMFLFPLELAFCVAQEPMESEVGQASVKLAKWAGSFMRTLDDVYDVEDDSRAGKLNWAFGAAWEKANDEQRSVLIECSCMGSKKGSVETLLKLYADLNIKEEFEIYKVKAWESLDKILDGCPDEIPKKSWKDHFDFYLKSYAGAVGSDVHTTDGA